VGDVLKVGQLGADTVKRGGRCCEEHVERVKLGMASRLTYPIGCLVADPFKAFLFVKCGLVIAASFLCGPRSDQTPDPACCVWV
jgi:hypothetical protein